MSLDLDAQQVGGRNVRSHTDVLAFPNIPDATVNMAR